MSAQSSPSSKTLVNAESGSSSKSVENAESGSSSKSVENAESGSSSKTLLLRSADKEEFRVDVEAAMMMLTIKMVDVDCVNQVIPLPNVSAPILIKIIDYCTTHTRANMTQSDLKNYDSEFVKEPHTTLLKLVMASSYLEISSLMELTMQAFADAIKDMSVECVRELLQIDNDFTPEEEAQVRNENEWAFEGFS